MSETVLSVRDLSVSIRQEDRVSTVVDRISFDVRAGEVLALVGESGCGKTKTAEAILGILPSAVATLKAECIELDGADLARLTEKELLRFRGSRISMVFQEPLTALDPVFTIGHQLGGIFRRHRGLSRTEARESSIGMLKRVGFADPGRVVRDYPHQLSGGMRQRVILAMAMACRPRLLIADEPTTALDVTTQAQVLAQLLELCQEAGTAILLITHDLGVVAQYCDRAVVMKEGKIVESAPVTDLFASPSHPYTGGLLESVAGRPR
jgi:ABC-type dipeptide/oligopeptide/nickel transport system ATPase component